MEDTFFAPASRLSPEALQGLAQETVDNPIFHAVLATVEGYVMVLDEHRQVLAANAELVTALGLPAECALVGLRPGEVLECIHADQEPGGCGTSQACSKCGAVLAILSAQEGLSSSDGECRLSFERNGQLEAGEYRVRATPLPLGDQVLIVLVLVDISAEKRRKVLESVFLHDLSNTLQGLSAMAEVIQDRDTIPRRAAEMILACSNRLKEEVSHQRLLMAAEAGHYVVKHEQVRIRDLFDRLESLYASRSLSRERRLVFTCADPDAGLRSDPDLILRILENMVTNALEATPPGGRVDVSFGAEEGLVRFDVRNPGVMDAGVALQVFQRSFSTKGVKGRGLGTFSMKLFGETYLGGQVSFTSTPATGTTFTLVL